MFWSRIQIATRPLSAGLLLRDGLRLLVDRLVAVGARRGRWKVLPPGLSVLTSAAMLLLAVGILAGPSLSAFIMRPRPKEGRARAVWPSNICGS